jgi:ubiquinone biosynthesis protein Coq4
MRFNPLKAASHAINIAKTITSTHQILNTKAADPHLLQDIFKMQEALDGTPNGERSINFQLENKEMKLLWEEKWQPERINLNKLKNLPEKSLGKVYANNLIRQGFTPDELLDLDPYPITNKKEFVIHRSWQVHDIIHTLTGFDVNSEGELGVQAFEFAQTQSPTALFLIFGLLFRFNGLLWKDHDFYQTLKALARGFTLGSNAKKFVYAIKLEEQMSRPLNDLRKELGLPTEEDTSSKFIQPYFYNF